MNSHRIAAIIFITICAFNALGIPQESPKLIYIFVALCDNENQGIIPVPQQLGNGEDPQNNLYWGALYGVKSFFKRSSEWRLLKTIQEPDSVILERCIFKHAEEDVYILADAYKGIEIKKCITDFLAFAAGQHNEVITLKIDTTEDLIRTENPSNLSVYVGHNGLMDFELENYPRQTPGFARDVIILACLSRNYFGRALETAGARPLLWTTGLMTPEAYTLEKVFKGWIENKSSAEICLLAAQAYAAYQNCGLNAAKRLFSCGE